MSKIRLFFTIILTTITFSYSLSAHITPPKLTVIFILDQFAHHYLPKIQKHFRYGLKEILDHGVVYKNAYHPHGIPETTPGHNAFNTAVLPKDHTATGNKWFTIDGKKTRYEEDYTPKHTKVDGFSDQFMLNANNQQHKVFSVSIKATAAISTANKLGKAIWFNRKTGNFTSSKKYFKQIPKWIHRFNQKKRLTKLRSFSWKTMYHPKSKAYNFPFIQDYEHTAYKFTMANNHKLKIDPKKKEPYELYVRSPKAANDLIDLAQECLINNLAKKSDDKMVLWICLSNLDLVGHMYGPNSLEAIDTIYHLDKQIMNMMNFSRRRYGSQNVLFVLSADHGIQPIQEIMVKKGITTARRIDAKKLINQMNDLIEEKYDVKNIIADFLSTYFVLNHKKFDQLESKKQNDIMLDLKQFLQKIKGIKKVWTRKELEQKKYEFNEFGHFYQNHLNHKREIDLICMPEVYCLITKYPTGCSHNTPYEYDTHVPLAFYLKKQIQHKVITKKVWIPQVPVTLARIHGISKPSATTFHELPGIFN